MNESLVISGSGVGPCLLALCLQRLRPEWRIHLAITDDHLPDGDAVPLSLEGVDKALIAALDPAVVAEWGSYHLLFDGFSRRLKGRVAMIAPEQLSAELLEAFSPEQICLGRNAGEERSIMRYEKGRHTVIQCGGCDAHEHSAIVTTESYLFAAPHTLAAPVLIDASGTWPDIDFLQYFPSSSHQLQIRHIARDGEPMARTLLNKSWPQAQLVGQRRERVPWEETAPRRLGEHRIALPALGARHGHPAFVSNTSHLLWMAEALARSETTSPDALLAELADAQAHRVHAFHAWQLVNDLLTTLDGDGKRLVLAALYARR